MWRRRLTPLNGAVSVRSCCRSLPYGHLVWSCPALHLSCALTKESPVLLLISEERNYEPYSRMCFKPECLTNKIGSSIQTMTCQNTVCSADRVVDILVTCYTNPLISITKRRASKEHAE
ncbi:hypothetical protein ASPBRDRAFT_383008 [Aspergillus brasiliensis CBS 101740]|uniref:Uncharacterized protein n=1 Tax=Aspergillus brasiliensis (strain CBS 101740 / IMI 381727 / IBT 21946) TaxID=767769 RepID=A0A1L9UVQ9_ASPBC|nr:hypothetical protein ASPBRDRAFT_383008 [Aspergillus brasiliensis CBS 101740]